MKKNVGGKDRILRILIGSVLTVFGFMNLGVWWGVALIVLGVVNIGTGLLGWCGLYKLFGINTCKIETIPPADNSASPSGM